MSSVHAHSRFVAAVDRVWESGGAGVQRQILGHDDLLMMVRVRFEKDAIGAVHTHPHRQVTFIESGSFAVQIGDDKKILHAGDSFFVPPDIPHGVVALSQASLVDVFSPARQDFLNASLLPRV
jgi:quercetin dioxygenase-like cupin family protein